MIISRLVCWWVGRTVGLTERKGKSLQRYAVMNSIVDFSLIKVKKGLLKF